MNNFAAIYVRTSSEHQAERCSPEEQERDCRGVAEQNGLTVVAVYQDTERYRAKRKLVDPSGTRTDRPGLNRMLEAATAGKFGTILAWREDRLYRGLRAMMYVLDVIQEHHLQVMLVKDTFDPKMAPIKAWVAGMELEAIRERMTMGVKARLRSGKANTGQDRYGYERKGEKIVVVQEEADWVRQIFEWYNKYIPLKEIRRRLIQAGAPQKGSSAPRKIEWAISSIQGVLKSAYNYAYGVKTYTRAGETFEISIEPIITMETYKRFVEVRESNKSYPSRNVKRDYLIGGLMYCQCPRKWGARGSSYKRGDKRRSQPTGVYFCGQRHEEVRHPDCPKTIGSKKADDFVWGKVVEVLDQPDVLISQARKHVRNWRSQVEMSLKEREKLQKELDQLLVERQWIITQARKGKITEEDMDYQIANLSMHEQYLKQDLTGVQVYEAMPEMDNWEERAIEHLMNLQTGMSALGADPMSEEDVKEYFQLKRDIVLALVEKVLIGKDREMKVIFKLDVLSLLGIDINSTSSGSGKASSSRLASNKSVGICNRKQSCLRRRRCAVCGSPFPAAYRC